MECSDSLLVRLTSIFKMSEIYTSLYFKLSRKEVNSEEKELEPGSIFP